MYVSLSLSSFPFLTFHSRFVCQENNTTYLTLRLRFTKGASNGTWNHRVTFSGHSKAWWEDQEEQGTDDQAMDMVYWFDSWIQHHWGLELESFSRWQLDDQTRDQKIWGWERDAMSQRLALRTVQAGYPKGLFSFHSLR